MAEAETVGETLSIDNEAEGRVTPLSAGAEVVIDELLGLLVLGDIDSEDLHVVRDDATASTDIDGRLLLITCQNPNLDSGLKRFLKRYK